LSFSSDPWKCDVSLRFLTDANGQNLGQIKTVPFGETIFDKKKVEERIRRAQRAILNPKTTSAQFLQGEDKDPADRQLTFSTNCVSLKISGNDVADLSFCDLPGDYFAIGLIYRANVTVKGLIASVGSGGNNRDITLVETLVNSYVSRPSCIILLTVTCESTWHLSPEFAAPLTL
jgi:hypothetical protein